MIDDAEYNYFIDTGKVALDILASIAIKIMNRTQLSQRETAIHAAKANRIEDIIHHITNERESREELNA